MRWYIFCKDSLLITKADSASVPEAATVPKTASAPEAATVPDGSPSGIPQGIPQGDCPVEQKPWHNVMRVTWKDGTELRTMRIDTPPALPHYEMVPLRQSYYKLTKEEYEQAGKCHELLYWDQNTQFCGVCGGRMRMHTEISKRCEECGKEIWPQLATAVIVRITRGDEILLVRARNFRKDFYGLVAGFVETGETLEEAVAREVREETGITISDITYFGSQPWPYPCGLMVGFTARYAGGEIHLQKEELTRGGWFKKDNLPNIPEKLSIARHLIDDWLAS